MRLKASSSLAVTTICVAAVLLRLAVGLSSYSGPDRQATLPLTNVQLPLHCVGRLQMRLESTTLWFVYQRSPLASRYRVAR